MVTDDLLFVAILGADGVEGTSVGSECLVSKCVIIRIKNIIHLCTRTHAHTHTTHARTYYTHTYMYRQTHRHRPGDGTLAVNSPILAVTLENYKYINSGEKELYKIPENYKYISCNIRENTLAVTLKNYKYIGCNIKEL